VWQFDNGDNTGSKFWRDLYNNPTFKCYLAKRWQQLISENNPLNFNIIAEKIDRIVSLISEAAVRENMRWGTVPNQPGEIAKMKSWIQNRMNWMNGRLNNYSACANPVIPTLVISKINYHPMPAGNFKSDDLEFIEITNNSNQSVNLTGLYFSEPGISYQFPVNSTIHGGDKIILAGNEKSFLQFYGLVPFGSFTRDLSNKSEKIVLADAFGNVIDSVKYLDSLPWPVEADSGGYFLQLTDLKSDNSLAKNWTISSDLSVGVNDEQLSQSVNVYPNPARTIITIDGKQNQITSFELFDLSGRKMISRNEINMNYFPIDIQKLLPGIYFIKLNFNRGESIIKKFSKM
jgi:hypothetical protein